MFATSSIQRTLGAELQLQTRAKAIRWSMRRLALKRSLRLQRSPEIDSLGIAEPLGGNAHDLVLFTVEAQDAAEQFVNREATLKLKS